jgi:hypothetical protein
MAGRFSGRPRVPLAWRLAQQKGLGECIYLW